MHNKELDELKQARHTELRTEPSKKRRRREDKDVLFVFSGCTNELIAYVPKNDYI